MLLKDPLIKILERDNSLQEKKCTFGFVRITSYFVDLRNGAPEDTIEKPITKKSIMVILMILTELSIVNTKD